jgi:hypothetical protein
LSDLKKGAAAVPGWMNDDFIPHEMNESGMLDSLDNVTYDVC